MCLRFHKIGDQAPSEGIQLRNEAAQNAGGGRSQITAERLTDTRFNLVRDDPKGLVAMAFSCNPSLLIADEPTDRGWMYYRGTESLSC